MAKARIQDVLETLITAVTNAIIAAGIANDGQVIGGFPVSMEMVKTFVGTSPPPFLVSIYPRPGSAKNVTRFPANDLFTITNPNVPMSGVVTISGRSFVLRFSGQVIAGLNVHAFVGGPLKDAHVQTVPGDTTVTLATKVAAAILALGIPGVTAVASANAVTIGGTMACICNIGGQGVLAKEVARVAQTVQISTWVQSSAVPPGDENPSDVLRWNLAQAISLGIGTYDGAGPWLALSDGAPMLVEYATEYLDDGSQSSYGVYAHHLCYRVEYPIYRIIPSAQIAAVEFEQSIDGGAVTTTYATGGP
jgi:hypothetical protein